MKIVGCKINHITNPLGYALAHISASWKVQDAKSKKQIAARILVAMDKNMQQLIYDTGKSEDLSSLGALLPIEIKPRTRYYWQVTVWGELGEHEDSEVNWFETGKMNEVWNADWITPKQWNTQNHPYIRTFVDSSKKIKKARAYVCGLGVYDLYLNGKKAGQEYLAPGCTTYDEWVQCYTYDVTEFFVDGKNIIGAQLGNGWAKARFGTFAMVNRPYIEQFLFLAEFHIEYEDGKTYIIKTDETWTCHESEIMDSGIYDGEICDMRKAVADWAKYRNNQLEWEPVEVIRPESIKNIEDRLSLPIIVKEYIKPVAILHTPAGETVLDMGQNMTGWIRMKVNEPFGKTVTLSYGEILQNNNFYNENLRTAKAQYTHTSDGIGREVEPHFTFYGFRYVKLEGFTSQIELNDFVGCVIYSDLEETGTIQTTDPLVNQLFQNAKWSQKGNFLDVPTDCPQRDERMGWTGDTQVFARTASFNMETYAFYRKFLHDLWMDQRCKNGMVGNVIPGFTPTKEDNPVMFQGGAAAWGDCAVIVPWELYQQYGDITILKEQYDSMCAWVDWIFSRIEKAGTDGLWNCDFQFGDWLALDGPIKNGTAGGTDEAYIATAYYKYSTEIVAKAADILGNKADAQKYAKRSMQAQKDIYREFFSENGRSTIKTQTAYLLALKMDLVPEERKERVISDFVEILKKDNMHLKTGFVGTPFLCTMLSKHEHSEMAYELFMQEDFPSWLYAVKMGATTIWERWDSVLPDGTISGTGMNSLNHYSYGSIVEWMYRNVCGIRQLEHAPGYTRFELKPEPDVRMYGAKAVYHSPKGTIQISWLRDNAEQMNMNIAIPFDTEARLFLPDADIETVILQEEHNDLVRKDEENVLGNFEAEQEGKKVIIHLPAGFYTVMYPLTRKYNVGYSTKYPLNTLKNIPETRSVLYDCMPMLDMIPEEFTANNVSFCEALTGIARMSNSMDAETLITVLDEKLSRVPLPIRRIGLE